MEETRFSELFNKLDSARKKEVYTLLKCRILPGGMMLVSMAFKNYKSPDSDSVKPNVEKILLQSGAKPEPSMTLEDFIKKIESRDLLYNIANNFKITVEDIIVDKVYENFIKEKLFPAFIGSTPEMQLNCIKREENGNQVLIDIITEIDAMGYGEPVTVLIKSVANINEPFYYNRELRLLDKFVIDFLNSSTNIAIPTIEKLIDQYGASMDTIEKTILTTHFGRKLGLVTELFSALYTRGFKFSENALTILKQTRLWDPLSKIKRSRHISLPVHDVITPYPHSYDEDIFKTGEYFFDGNFMVVKFKKGTKMYHGSAALSNASVKYPVGRDFYTPDNFVRSTHATIDDVIAAESPFQIDELLTEKSMITQSWFSTLENAAKYYSKLESIPGCAGNCIASYSLKRDAVFFLLDNEYNIKTILESPDFPEELKYQLKEMFTMTDKYEFILDPNDLFRRYKLSPKTRASAYDRDRRFANLFFEHLERYNYAGYCAPKQPIFHSELIVENAILYLERDLEDPHDIFFDGQDYPSELKILFNQMKYYETTNTNFHAGNLLEHSIWTLLFCESLTRKFNINGGPPLNLDRLTRIVVIAGLLHDIGKMSPEHCLKNDLRKKYIYFDIKDHPKIGSDYFETGIPVLNDSLEVVDSLNPLNVIRALLPDIYDYEIDAIKESVKNHWEFGKNVLGKYKQKDKSQYKTAVDEYAKLFQGEHKILSAIVVMIVSTSDIEATQPFSTGKLENLATKDEIQKTLSSNVFGFLINSKPKIYRGTNLAQLIKVSDIFIQAMNDVLKVLEK